MRVGLSAIKTSPWLWVTIIVAAFGNICFGSVRMIGIPLVVKVVMNSDVKGLGLLNTTAAIAGMASAVILGSVKRLRWRGISYYAAHIIAGLGLVWMSRQSTVAGALPAMVLLGLAPPLFGLIWTGTLQQMIPRDKLGRVISLDSLGSFALCPSALGWLAGMATWWAHQACFWPQALSLSGLAW